MFAKPTLVTLTSPTCAGKSYLLNELIDRQIFTRLVSTTDRPARVGEVEGRDYYFISTDQSKQMEAEDQFAELVTYNGVRYGVTHAEMILKMDIKRPPIVILEPSGLDIYRQYCAHRGYGLYSIFVNTPEPVRLQRLVERSTRDLVRDLEKSRVSDSSILPLVQKHIAANNSRLKAVLDHERSWVNKHSWNIIVDGTDLEKAISDIKLGMKSHYDRREIYS